jgi:hypothetical protein
VSDIDDEDIDDIVDSFFDAREAIFEHVGYVEDWRVLPIVDHRDDFWAVDEHEHEWVKFSPSREALLYWLAEHDDEYGTHGDKLYQHEIYTQRHLSKWVLRGKELTIVVVDTHTDGNQYLQLFCNDNEVHPGDPVELSTEQPAEQSAEQRSSGPTEHPLNQAIDRMIEADQQSHADSLLAKVRSMCSEIPIADLKIAIVAHRASCHQPNCPVLAAMEESAAEPAP